MEGVMSLSFKLGGSQGFGLGLMYFFILCADGVGFWYGAQCVAGTILCPPWHGKTYLPGDVVVILFSILNAGFNLTQTSPAILKII
jgi:hypothetical protein